MIKGDMTPSPIRICEIYDDGEACRHFTFEPVDRNPYHKVEPGQFFTLTVPGYGEAAFTYLSLPDEKGRFKALIRKAGELTGQLFLANNGDLLGFRGPFGNQWPLNQLHGKRVLVIAGGIGLPPLAGAVDAMINSHDTKVALIYGSRTEEAQVLKYERSAWHLYLTSIETIDQPGSNSLYSGTPLDHVEEAVEQLGGEPEAVLTCGPGIMMEAVGAHFQERGLPADKIWLAMERRMHCGIGICGHCYIGSSYACTDGPIYSWDTLSRLRKQTTA